MANNRENQEEFSLKKELIEWVVIIEIAIIAAVIINLVFLVNAVIPSGSMEPTIMTGDRIFGNRLAYKNEDPAFGDIIIFRYPDDERQLFIKRIIGMPGDTVLVVDGDVYLNGSDTPIDEPYVKVDAQGDFGPYVVPEDSYFVMGDNRNNSADSRYWINTFVKREKILGKAWVRYYPNPCRIQ